MKVIIVRGGLVRGVYSDRREEIYVFDYDGDDSEVHELLRARQLFPSKRSE